MIDISVVGYEHENLHDKAKALAEELNFVLDKNASPCLFVTEEKLTLKIPGFSPMFAEFSAAFWSKRKSEGKKQGLVRACKPSPELKIIDATAGWGRDSAILASFGAEVLMLERHPVMASLLSDALLRRTESDRQQLRLKIHAGDAYSYLSSLTTDDYPDIIYIDPMHPERSKSALVKKDMQALQQIIGADEDALELIQIAISRTKQKVVVKWPQKAKPLLPANAAVEGKTVRFDIYFSNLKVNE
ncbi:class I SAM-dependent methyltransferase [Fluoribacter gormanii]|uniref:class I SAM-dependent methyltransferase n=1 Tax=Fluoribacter gormanii TaxID=464 RepID=UPI00104104FE|nr:class I SAM-dependent methyltransferase [Fluoribacter gormanii]MCW8444057.1 class I SAM-dependent methyltransferase [Fluoribacter gormanii]MCW8469239.1 class I SAM-dependent methyltransferase [Fluoribacter gormanii]